MTPEILSQSAAPQDIAVSVVTIYSVITAAFGFCGTLLKILWDRSKDCEKWRAEKEPLILAMAKSMGLAQGTAEMVNSCHIKACPFAGKIDATFSVETNKETKTLKKPKL